MSDPRPTANETATRWLREWNKGLAFAFNNHDVDRLAAAIEADRAASDAREDRLRRLVRRLFAVTKHFSECVCVTCEDTRETLAAIPPRSDR